MSAIQSTTLGVSQPMSCDLSLWNMFWSADWVVKLVILILLGLSFWCWTVIIAKFLMLRRLNREAYAFEEQLISARSMTALLERFRHKVSNPYVAVFQSVLRDFRNIPSEILRHSQHGELVQQRLERVANMAILQEEDILGRYMGFLASVGSTAPFIGLFGTVWGIMHSFQSIASMQTTNLAVVAPGIAEALFATALGLVAAIPATTGYNYLAGLIDNYMMRLDLFAQELRSMLVYYGEDKK